MLADDPRAVAFKEAVGTGDAAAVRRLTAGDAALRAAVDKPWFPFGMPAIVCAVMGRKGRETIDALLEAGADINARSNWQAGPYGVLDAIVDAQAPVDVELANYLIGRGARLDLHAAAGLGRLDVLTELLDASPDRVSEPGPDGATPLHLAMDVEVARFLLDRGADIDKRCVTIAARRRCGR